MQKETPKNLLLPYDVFCINNVYSFQTDFNLTYACRFCYLTPHLPPLLGVYDIEIYDFEFYPIQDYKAKPKDEKIALTLAKILKDFFSNERRVLVYVCDSADGRGKERQLLFKFWHSHIADVAERHPLTITVGHKGTAFGSVLTHNGFLYLDVLQEHFIQNIQPLMEEKHGE